MTRHLVLFEDAGWRTLRPLTDTLPVAALAFGASTLAARWIQASGLPLAAVAARPEVVAAWSAAPVPGPRPAPGDRVLAANAAALPGPWLERAAAGEDLRLECGGRVVAVAAAYERLSPGLGDGAAFHAFLRGLPLPAAAVEARLLDYPWRLIEWNAEAIAADLEGGAAGIEGEVDERAALLEPRRIHVAAGARVDPFAVIDARDGPVRLETGVRVLAHTVVRGPCVVGAGTQLLGGLVARSTIGPECRIAGEVEECVWQGYGNKRHHGFVGHSALGEWVNLGALTTTSDLKNNYGPVRVWIDGREVDSGSPKVGSMVGAHVKTGIGTLLPTGAAVGAGSNLFGGGVFAPKRVPPFSWWDGREFRTHRVEEFLATARVALSRRGRSLGRGDEELLRALHRATAAERSWEEAGLAASRSGAAGA